MLHERAPCREELQQIEDTASSKARKSSQPANAGVRIARTALCVNVAIAVANVVGSCLFQSKTLMAEAAHAATDIIADVVTLVAVSLSSHAKDASSEMTYRRVQRFATLAISLMLLSGGLGLGLDAAKSLRRYALADGAQLSPDHGAGLTPNATFFVVFEIIAKTWLYYATMRTARQTGNIALESGANHHGMDALGALVPFCTALISGLVPNAEWLDAIGGLGISSMVVMAGWQNSRKALAGCVASHGLGCW